MTYCIAMNLREGMLFASDSRTNAGVDHIATFRKMHIFETPGERRIVMVCAGNLATTQSVVSRLRQGVLHEDRHILSLPTLYDVAELVGRTVREVIARDSGPQAQGGAVDYSANFLVGGQIRGEEPRLFQVYPQGNFIESTTDTPYLQIGESKYGKPIIDRIVHYDTALNQAVKCALISFDSTIRSNLSVGLPLDIILHLRDDFAHSEPYRLDEEHPYLKKLRTGWSQGVRQLFKRLPEINLKGE